MFKLEIEAIYSVHWKILGFSKQDMRELCPKNSIKENTWACVHFNFYVEMPLAVLLITSQSNQTKFITSRRAFIKERVLFFWSSVSSALRVGLVCFVPFKLFRQWKWTEFYSVFQISLASWSSWLGSQRGSSFSWHKLTLELQFWCDSQKMQSAVSYISHL